MIADRTIQILATAGCLAAALSLAPAHAQACSPEPDQFDILPSDGDVVPPDVQLHFVSIWPPTHTWFAVDLTDGDGNAVPIDIGGLGYSRSYGQYGFSRSHYVGTPTEPLTPGTYTLQAVNHNSTIRTSTFAVSEEVSYAAPPSVTSLEWHTRVFDETQPPRDSCQYEFQQQSRITFPLPDQGEDRRTLFYQVRFALVDEFDGDINRTEDSESYSNRFLAADMKDGSRFGDNYSVEVDADTVTLYADTQFHAECVAITAIDVTGQRGETFVDCMPDLCAPPEEVESREDWEWFRSIDWSEQPDCSSVYCYDGDCSEASEDAGSQPTDVGPQPADAGSSGDAGPSGDAGGTIPNDPADAGVEDVARSDSSLADASHAPDGAGSSQGEGCSSASGRVPPVGSAALALLVGLGVAVRARCLNPQP